jgi:inosine-uridine nucleoside N-ribohydrolase
MKTSGRIRRIALPLLCVLASVGSQTAWSQNAAAKPQSVIPVIIDTDIGDDIDDAFAIALALRSPELNILGVTTTFRDTEMRARLVDRYLKAVGREDIPVAAGPATKLGDDLSQKAYALRSPSVLHADGADFILSQARKRPGEITLIAIGPLFTVQAAIEKDPAAFRKLNRVVLMGGSIERGYGGKDGERRPPEPEWNILNDPAGLRALLNSGVPVFMMPLDSTQVKLPVQDQEKIFAHGSPITDQLTLLYHEWLGNAQSRNATPTLFDPVAVTYTFRPDLCPAKPMRIEVDDKGLTRPVPGDPNAQVCLQSDEQGFLKLLLDRTTGD